MLIRCQDLPRNPTRPACRQTRNCVICRPGPMSLCSGYSPTTALLTLAQAGCSTAAAARSEQYPHPSSARERLQREMPVGEASKRPGPEMQAPPLDLEEMAPMALPVILEEGVLAYTSFVHSFHKHLLSLFPLHSSFQVGEVPAWGKTSRFWHFSHQRVLCT